MNKKFILTVLSLFVAGSLFSQKVSLFEAKKVARNAYIANKQSEISLQAITAIVPVTENSDTLLYVIKYPAGGFAIISADKSYSALLGYCDSGDFDSDDIPPGLQYLMSRYKSEITDLKNSNTLPDKERNNQWLMMMSDNGGANNYGYGANDNTGSRLLSTKWGQSPNPYITSYPTNYNRFCEGNLAGCTAVAMAQILRYWACRINPIGAYSYYNNILGVHASANFGATTYNWSAMHDDQADDDNALLIRHAGVSCNTLYGKTGSSAMTEWARNAFVDFWGIKSSADKKSRTWYSSNTWKTMLRNEIYANRPVLYGGQNLLIPVDGRGHSWVIDGYMKDLFHCNWGWRGSYNGWYSLADFHPRGEDGNYGDKTVSYNHWEDAIFGIEPVAEVGIGYPELSPTSFMLSTSGYVLSIPEVYGATSYEWTTNEGRIEGNGRSARLYSIKNCSVTVKAKNSRCNISASKSVKITLNCAPLIRGDEKITETATYTLGYLPQGATVTWSLKDNQFEIFSFDNESITIQSNNFGLSDYLVATINYEGITYTLTKYIFTAIDIIGSEYIDTRTNTYTINAIYPDITSYQWTASSNIEFTGSTTGPTVKARAIENANYTSISLTAVLNGKTYTKSMSLTSVIPTGTSVKAAGSSTVSDGKISAPFILEVYPTHDSYDRSCYQWYISTGRIQIPKDYTLDFYRGDHEITTSIVPSSVSQFEAFDRLTDVLQENDDVELHVSGGFATITADNYSETLALSTSDLPEKSYIVKSMTSGKSVSDPESSMALVELIEANGNQNAEEVEHLFTYITPGLIPPTPYPPIDKSMLLYEENRYGFMYAIYPENTPVTITCSFKLQGMEEALISTWSNNVQYYLMAYAPSIKSFILKRSALWGSMYAKSTLNFVLRNSHGIVYSTTFYGGDDLVQIPVNLMMDGIYYATITSDYGTVLNSQTFTTW